MSKVIKDNRIVAYIVFVVILVIVGVFIFSGLSNKSAKIEVSENQKNIDIKTGQEFVITLTSNPSTGYNWSVDNIYNKNIISMISSEFRPTDTKMSGVPGTELWTFKGAGKGNTKLSFKYTRQRDDKTSQLDSKIYIVSVK